MRSLDAGWRVLVVDAGTTPADDAFASGAPHDTAALSALATAAATDARDVWARLEVEGPFQGRVVFPRLGPLAEIFVDGQPRLATRSLFHAHRLPLELGPGPHALTVCLRSIRPFLAQRRPRPRWKTRLTEHQQLRWLRAPLLGRMPSWSPTGAPRGLLDAPYLVEDGALNPDELGLHAALQGTDGVVTLTLPAGVRCSRGALRVGGASAPVVQGRAELGIADPPRWWPHTHGDPTTLPATLVLDGVEHALDPVGFRSVTVEDPRRFALRVNGVPVFCRGAVFVPSLYRPHVDSIRSGAAEPRLHSQSLRDTGSSQRGSGLDGDAADRRALEALRDAGGNMVRVGGTMRYEPRRFFRDCDELGLLVWQDFMFANMDYPIDDAEWLVEVGVELDEQLARWARHPSLAVLCGGSEVAQQAAMVGQPPERWYGPLFERLLPERCAAALPGVPYVPNSPSSPVDRDPGGDGEPPPLPFRPDVGVAHYYGVSAYRRPFDDARRADVAFATECLAFANVPEPATVEAIFGDLPPSPHDPRWKAGVPRDNGVGWDFEDVRDHYHALLFHTDIVDDRYADAEGYLERARITSVEAMRRTYAEWRRAGSRTHGGLVWFLRDLVPGAGWGLLDHASRPKAALLGLASVWSPTALLLTDEGNNGLRLHVAHEGPAPRTLRLRVSLHRAHGERVAETERVLEVAPRSTRAVDVEGLFGAFRDVGWSYRFGPRAHEVLLATLHDGDALVGEAAHLPTLGSLWRAAVDPQLTVAGRRLDERSIELTLTSARLALYVVARVPGWRAREGYFHLRPGEPRRLRLQAEDGAAAPKGEVCALGAAPLRVVIA